MSVVDLVIAGIVILSVIIGFKRGFIKTLVGLVSLVLAFVIAYTFAAPISEKLYDSYLETKLSSALGFDLGGEETETGVFETASSEASRLLFLGGTNLFIAPKLASTIDVSKLKNIEGMISKLDPDLVAGMDAGEMQKLVNFLCSSACANKTISSCVSAYNKKYGTKIDATPILKAAGVSGSAKIPAAISMLGMKIDVKNPILNVQKKNAEAAAVAAKAASSKASSKSSSKSTSKSSNAFSGSKSNSSKTANSSTTSPKTSSKIASAATAAEVPSATDVITDTVDGFTQDILATARQAARKIAVKLVGCAVFVVLFILIRLILMLFAKLLSGIIDKIPIVSGINKLLGGILGIAGGLIVSAVLVIGVVSVSPLITNDKYVQAVDNSLACRTATKLIYGGPSSGDAVTVGDSGMSEDSFDEDDFDFKEEDFDFSENSLDSSAG